MMDASFSQASAKNNPGGDDSVGSESGEDFWTKKPSGVDVRSLKKSSPLSWLLSPKHEESKPRAAFGDEEFPNYNQGWQPSRQDLEYQNNFAANLAEVPQGQTGPDSEDVPETGFDDKLSGRGMAPGYWASAPPAETVGETTTHPAENTFSSVETRQNGPFTMNQTMSSGGRMADLSAYKDLSKAPLSFGDEDMSSQTNSEPSYSVSAPGPTQGTTFQSMTPTQHFVQEVSAQEVDTEFSGNVKTLIRLVNELPEGVTKQTGAQIIRLTMEAMGISMENVLSEAQSAQSEMLDAVRANIKKIEEYKTVIRKLETDIKYYQGKANELSEIIDLFILSNTSGQKVPFPDDLSSR